MRYGLENIIRLVSKEGKTHGTIKRRERMARDHAGRAVQDPDFLQGHGRRVFDTRIKSGPPNRRTRPHHDNEEEHFIIVAGTVQIAVAGKTQDFPVGTSVTVSKRIPHAWCNLTGSLVRFIVIFTPGRIEGLFGAVAAKKVDDVKAFASSYGTRIIGPAVHPGLNNIFTPAPRQTRD
jgi:mannose-6-phosphate isomerase-like protein (cupin superfamily)